MDRYHDQTNAAIEQVRSSTLTETLSRQLAELNDVLSEVHGRLESRYSNVFGPRPISPTEPTAKLQSVPTHAAAEITDGARAALNKAHGLNGLVSDLLNSL